MSEQDRAFGAAIADSMDSPSRPGWLAVSQWRRAGVRADGREFRRGRNAAGRGSLSEDSRGPGALRRIAASIRPPRLSGWDGGCPAAAAIRKHFRQDPGGVLCPGRRSRARGGRLTGRC